MQWSRPKFMSQVVALLQNLTYALVFALRVQLWLDRRVADC
jgi:hypothetical protein